MSKTQLGTLARCLEAGLGTAMVLSFDDWRVRLAEHPQAKLLAEALVWRLTDRSGGGTNVVPVSGPARVTLHDVRGAVVAANADHRLSLWHPSDASAGERNAWRDRISALRIRQPFKQVFREHYIVSTDDLAQEATTMFSGHAVSIRPFLGLARREGWRLEYEYLARTVGALTVTIDLAHRLFPGAFGWTTIRGIRVQKASSRKHMPARLGDLSAVALSEILRSVDLLVSASSFALASSDEGDPYDSPRQVHIRTLVERPLGPMAEMRKDALARVLEGRDGMAELRFDARHLRLGAYAIHLATCRVTRDGDPITIETPDRSKVTAVPWLPYDEQLLEIIAVTALQIGQGSRC